MLTPRHPHPPAAPQSPPPGVPQSPPPGAHQGFPPGGPQNWTSPLTKGHNLCCRRD